MQLQLPHGKEFLQPQGKIHTAFQTHQTEGALIFNTLCPTDIFFIYYSISEHLYSQTLLVGIRVTNLIQSQYFLPIE